MAAVQGNECNGTNHSYNQLIKRKQTDENTIESVSSTLLSDFVSEIPINLALSTWGEH